MKTRIVLAVCVLLLGASGCGSTAGNIGLGVGAGGALSNTISGVKADLERKEAELIALYNQGVEDGWQVKELEALRQRIYDTRLGKEAVETSESLLGIDWNNPKQTGGAFGALATLAYAYWKRKELAQITKKYVAHKKVVNNLIIEGKPEEAQEIYEAVGKARNSN